MAEIVGRENELILIQVAVRCSRNMLTAEENIQKAVNEVGNLATCEMIKQFDTDGSPIKIGNEKFTSKGQEPKTYQTPYGEVNLERHVYQSSQGGQTYCPLEVDARIIITSTPRFAKIVSHKYSNGGAGQALEDLEESNSRKVSRSFVQNIAEAVSSTVEAKESVWSYDLPELPSPVKSVSIGLDGTCMLLCKEGYRQAMVGTIALFDRKGKRMHTIYTAATPEYGKETFINRFEAEIQKVKDAFPKAEYIGIADGAKDNWPFLEKHTGCQILDFWHATQYLSSAADAMYTGKNKQARRKEWLDLACHKLKHTQGSASRLLNEMKLFRDNNNISPARSKKIGDAITYFTNHKKKMKYAVNTIKNYPIGSGITEAACKVIVKQRLCCSGMKWKEPGAAAVLRLRTLNRSTGRWSQFWSKVGQYGLPIAA